MAYASRAYECKPICNYNAAERHMNETKPVRSEKWRSDERPLRKRSQYHYRLQHGTWQGRSFYDVIHHRTPLIRYWEPFDNGDHVVSLFYWNSMSSRDFMSAHRWGGWNRLTTTTGTEVCMPLSSVPNSARWFQGSFESPFDGTNFTAHLVFDESRKLKVDESVMVPVCKPVSSDHDKTYRASIRNEIRVFKDIMLIQFQRIRDNVTYNHRDGVPFQETKTTRSDEYHTIRSLLTKKLVGVDLDDAENARLMQALIDVGQHVYNSLASKSAWSAGALKYDWRSRLSTIAPDYEPPEFDAFVAAFERTVIKAVGGDRTSAVKLIGDMGVFPLASEMPRNYKFTQVSDFTEFFDVYKTLLTRFEDIKKRLSKV